MERKLVKQGRNAITMTLPSEWIKQNNLSQNDSVQVNENNNELIVSTNYNKKEKLECEINLKDCLRSYCYHVIQGKYIEGYDKIIINHNSPELIQQISKILIGFIVEEHSNTKTILKNLIVVPEENFEEIFRRTTQLFLKQARTLTKLTKKEATYEQLKAEEYLLDDNLLYCLRYLKKYEKNSNSYKYFLLCSTLESAGDLITEIAKEIKKDTKLAELIEKSMENYITALLTKNSKLMYNSLREFRKKIPRTKFVNGLAHSLAETLYNFMGYLIEKEN